MLSLPHPLASVTAELGWLHCTPGITQMMSRNILESAMCLLQSFLLVRQLLPWLTPLTQTQGRPLTAE